MAVVNAKLFVIGGRWRGRGNLAVIEVYDPARDGWSRKADMPTPRGGHTAGALGGRIHVTGGEAFSPSRTFAAHQVFDPKADRWTVLDALPTARHGLGSAAVNGRWYVIGGGTGAGAKTFVTLTGAVEIFTP